MVSADPDRAAWIPKIADYKRHRKLLHPGASGRGSPRALERLDELGEAFLYLPLDTPTMRRAAELWAKARRRGLPTAPDAALGGDVILATQALAVGGTVVTTNLRHLARFVAAATWDAPA